MLSRLQYQRKSVLIYVFILLLNDPYLLPPKTAQQIRPYLFPFEPINQIYTQPKTYAGAQSISLSYVLNGGNNSMQNPCQVMYTQMPLALDVPVREGYNFAGWYEDPYFQKKVTEISRENAKNMTLFAKWTEKIDSDYNVQTYPYLAEGQTDETQKELKDCTYRFLEHIEIPGMPSTREQDVLYDVIENDAQCLQGLCFTPDFILISSYSEDVHTHGSLMVFDRRTGQYRMSLKMKKQSHLGGIAYDGENIWVCHSNSRTLERIPYQNLLEISRRAYGTYVDISSVTQEYRITNIPSCITYYEGKLWVATHTQVRNSKMVCYSYDKKKGRLTVLETYNIPPKVQGVAFDAKGAVYLSTSYGRNNSSYLKGYLSLSSLHENPNSPAATVEMPPCSEQIAAAENKIYVIFESANQKYFEGTDGKGKSTSPIDKILEITTISIWQT